MDPKDTLLNWLADAYGMETGIIPILESQTEATQDQPGIQAKLREHLAKTKSHAETVKHEVERLGGDVSALKSGAAAASGWLQGLAAGMAKDRLIKDLIGDYATEHFEIAAYTALIAAAEEIGEQGVIDACEKILADEEEMASWLADQLPDTTQKFLREKA